MVDAADVKIAVLKCALGIKSLDDRALFEHLERFWADAFRAGCVYSSGYPNWRTRRTSMDRNIAAFTPPGLTPPYISINERGGMVEITVRSPGTPDGDLGASAAITMTRDDFERVLKDGLAYIASLVDLGDVQNTHASDA